MDTPTDENYIHTARLGSEDHEARDLEEDRVSTTFEDERAERDSEIFDAGYKLGCTEHDDEAYRVADERAR